MKDTKLAKKAQDRQHLVVNHLRVELFFFI